MKTAFITAMNPGNMGMYTVDRAIIELFGERRQSHRIFCAHPPFKRGYYKLKKLGIDIGLKKKWNEGIIEKEQYSNLQQLQGFDNVIFWGDFTVNPEYGHHDFIDYDLRFALSRTPKDAIDRWRTLFSSKNMPGSRVMSFGQNFLHDSLAGGMKFFDEARSVMAGVSMALPRDSGSTDRFRGLELPGCRVTHGCDAAMLKIVNETFEAGRDYFVYYFSRSNFDNKDEIISTVSDKLKLKPIELYNWNWFKTDFEKRWSDLRSLIKKSKFVITDMYHCAINSIALLKIPLVIGNPSISQSGTLGDFKKKILTEDCRLSEYFFETDENSIINTLMLEKMLNKAKELQNISEEETLDKLCHVRSIAEGSRNTLFDFVERR